MSDKNKCIGYSCVYVLSFWAPQFPKDDLLHFKDSSMDNHMCAGGPDGMSVNRRHYLIK